MEAADASAPPAAITTRESRLAPIAKVHDLATLRATSTIARPGDVVRASDGARLARPHVDVRVPTTSRGAVHLEVSSGFWLDVAPASIDADVAGTVEDGALVFADAARDTDVVQLASAKDGVGRYEEVRVLRTEHAPTRVSYAIAIGPSVSELRLREGIVEALDGEGRAILRSPAAWLVDARGVRRTAHVALAARGGGYRLDVTIDDRGLAHPIVLDPGWLPAAGMAVARHGFGSVTLPDGRVVAIAGSTDVNVALSSTTGPGALSSTEIFDPATATWTLGTALATARTLPGVALVGKKVVVAGGANSTGSLASVEVLDFTSSASGQLVASVPPMRTSRLSTLVASLESAGGQKVFVGGGFVGSTFWNDGEVFDLAATPPTKVVVANNMSSGHEAFALPIVKGVPTSDAQALMVGGPNSTADVYDLASNTFTSAPSMKAAHCQGTGLVLPSGNVLVTGGYASNCNTSVPTAEIYDVTTKTWKLAANAPSPGRAWSGVTVIPAVGSTPAIPIAAGGILDQSGQPATAEVWSFDEASATWSPFGTLSLARGYARAAGLADGSAIVFGGGSAALIAQNFASTERTGTAKAQATTCTGNGECASGFCADGVCCDTPCNDDCNACAEPGSVGTCVTITGANRPGHPLCNNGNLGDPKCGYQCNGSGPTSAACTLATASIVCAPATCTAGGLYAAAQTCGGGGGACPAQASVNCAPFGCTTAGCKTTCASDADCTSLGFCDVASSACKPKLDDGRPATGVNQCKSGFAADGVCCHTACAGACTSCAITGSEGTCTAVADGVTDGHGVCPLGACSTCRSGACALQPNGTACGVDGCTHGMLTTVGRCDGATPNCPNATIAACANGLACADATRCKTSCATDADCAIGACDVAHGVCITASDTGVLDSGATDAVAEAIAPQPTVAPITATFQRCEHDADCPNSHCVEGVCCDSACTDRCHSCALPSAPGKCTLEPIGTDLRNECGPSLSCLGTCDGAGSCIGAGPGSQCARNRCDTASTGVGAAFCASAGGACDINAVVEFDCAPYACEPAFGACRSSCVSTNDCAPGNECDTTSQRCVQVQPPSPSGGCGVGAGAGEASAAWLAALVAAKRRADARR